MMDAIVFEDPLVERLFPISISRPAYAITCGSFRLIDWLAELGVPLQGHVRPHLCEFQRIDFPQCLSHCSRVKGPALLVNARLVPAHRCFRVLRRLLDRAEPFACWAGNSLAAAVVPPGFESSLEPAALARSLSETGWGPADSKSKEAELATSDPLPLLEYPHEVIHWNVETLAENLAYRLERGEYREIAEGVYAGPNAKLGQYVVSETSGGPILLDEGASVGPYCFLEGPAYLGPRVRVLEHAAIKDAVSVGHTSKVGGEVEASVIEPYSNKQHHGFLGHSYLGSWINLGAGTCNSDLKNTYGPVKMEYRGRKQGTGMQFVGCIMGDYAKSAINTGIFTGKVIGACSMVYGFVTTNVPSFVNYARLFGQVTELPPEVMIATQQRMFQRRNVEQRPCDIQLIRDMYQLTRDERQLAGEPLSL